MTREPEDKIDNTIPQKNLHTHDSNTKENKRQSVAAGVQLQRSEESSFKVDGNRPEAAAQRKLQKIANNSLMVSQQKSFQVIANNSLQAKHGIQFQAMADNHSPQQGVPTQRKENKTGLPDQLKSGVENLSGYSMDDVKVHYNSSKPAQLHAHAYAQGNDIHLASGQEKHLPHEAWHVVQQKQGRVKPTMQTKDKINVNDEKVLENEADLMGEKALQLKDIGGLKQKSPSINHTIQLLSLVEYNQLLTVEWAGRRPTLAEANALNGFNSLDDIRRLANLAQVVTWADLVSLVGSNRSIADIEALSGLMKGGFVPVPPTMQHILALNRFTLAEIRLLLPLWQVSTWDQMAQLGQLTRSAADIITLAGIGGPFGAPSLANIIALDRFTGPEIVQIRGLAQYGGWTDLVALATSNRPVADIVALAGLLKGFATPTMPQILALNRFTLTEIQQLRPLWQVMSWADIVRLAGLNRSAADLVTLAGLGFAQPTLDQIIAMDRFTGPEIVQIRGLAQYGGWTDLVALATSNRPVADIVALAGLLKGFATPTMPQILALNRFTLTEIQQLRPLWQVMSWADIVRLAGLNRSAADLITFAGLGAPTRPSLAQIIAMDHLTVADIQTMMAWEGVNNWVDAASLAYLTSGQVGALELLAPPRLKITIIHMAKNGPGIDRNTALKVITGTVRAHDRPSVPLPNSVALCHQNGFDPTNWTYYMNPVDGTPIPWLNGMSGKSFNATNVIVVFAEMNNIDESVNMLIHEINHSVNIQPADPLAGVADFKEEFRAYWVAQYRNVAHLPTRTGQIFNHIMANYGYISGPYNSNLFSHNAIDQFCHDAANGLNVFAGRNTDNS